MSKDKSSRALPAFGMVIALMGASVIAGWLLRLEFLVQPHPLFGLMVAATAFSFMLAGAAVALHGQDNPLAAATRRWLAAAVAAIAAAVLLENMLGANLGIDFPQLHGWLQSPAAEPGRMASSTAIALLCWSTAFLLLPVAHRSRTLQQFVHVLTVLLIAIGIADGSGRLMRFDLIFEYYPFALMALHTAGGLISLGILLWLEYSSAPWHVRANAIDEYQRITWVSATALSIAIAVGGMLGFFVLSNRVQSSLNSSLMHTLWDRTEIIEQALDERYARALIVATRPSIHERMRKLQSHPHDSAASTFLEQTISSFLPFGFTGITLLDRQGKVLVEAGHFSSDPEFSLPVRTAQEASLAWTGRILVLRHRMPIVEGDEHLGTLNLEQPLQQLATSLFDGEEFGKSAELQICGLRDGRIHCFPNRRNSTPFSFAPSASKQPGPMELALKGIGGTSQTVDFKGKNVIAAHNTLAARSLGIVIKVDTADFYAPVRSHLLQGILLLVLMVVIGTMLLRALAGPLITRLSRSEWELRLSEERLQLAVDASRLALWDWDVPQGKVYLSAQWNALLGGEARPSIATPQQLQDLVHADDLPHLQQRLAEVLKGNAVIYDCDHRVRSYSDEWKWVRSRGKVVERDRQGRALRLAGTNSDISARKQAEFQLAHRASHDGLTDLPNRSLYIDRVGQAIARSARNKTLMSVMYLDIDKFKSINDTLGHAVGDALLKAFAQRLAHCVRSSDTVARLGGDEFAVLLGEVGSREEGGRVAEKIVLAMRPAFTLEYRTLAITTSVGVAFYDGTSAMTADKLVKKADEALYLAKGTGRNNYQVVD